MKKKTSNVKGTPAVAVQHRVSHQQMKARVPSSARSAGWRAYHKRAIQFRARGLTSRGMPYLRTPNYQTRAAALDAARERNLRSWSRLAVSRIINGLTTRGGRRVLRLKYFDSFLLATEIDAAAASLDIAFPQLPTSVQPACLRLAESFAALRRRLPQKQTRA